MSAMDWALSLGAALIVAGYLYMMVWLVLKMFREPNNDE